MDTDALFWAKVDRRSDDECWPWLAYVDPIGYGRFHVDGEQRAHRWSYRRFIGPIEPGKVIDHICRNRRCVNPQHLRLLTPIQNTMAPGSLAPAKLGREAVTCARGHPWIPENTGRQGKGRYCRACRNAKVRQQRAASRQLVCPLGHRKSRDSRGRLRCMPCWSEKVRREPRPAPLAFACGHLRTETGRLNRRGVLYCGPCRSDARLRHRPRVSR